MRLYYVFPGRKYTIQHLLNMLPYYKKVTSITVLYQNVFFVQVKEGTKAWGICQYQYLFFPRIQEFSNIVIIMGFSESFVCGQIFSLKYYAMPFLMIVKQLNSKLNVRRGKQVDVLLNLRKRIVPQVSGDIFRHSFIIDVSGQACLRFNEALHEPTAWR